MDSLKRMLKRMFKGGKKNKQDADKPQETSSSSAAQAGGATAAKTDTTAAPPQLPPVQNASPLQSPDVGSQPLPSSHPLNSDSTTKPQDDEPRNTDAPFSGPVNPSKVDPPKEENAAAEEEKKKGEVVPTAEGTKPDEGLATQINNPLEPPPTTSDPEPRTSLATENNNPLEPPKTDSAVEAPKTVSDLAKENNPPTASAITNGDDDGKMLALHEEPPPINPAKPAPGMSATSGPLEDFPEGGVRED